MTQEEQKELAEEMERHQKVMQIETMKARLAQAKMKYATKAFEKDLKAWADDPANMHGLVEQMERAMNAPPFDLDKYIEEEKKNGIRSETL